MTFSASTGSADGRGEQAADLVDSDRDQPVVVCRVWLIVFALVSGDDGEERVGEHREDGPALPGGPGSDLVLVESGEFFPGLERFLDGPAPPGDSDERGQRDGPGRVRAVERQLPSASVAADEQPVLAGEVVVAGVDQRPVVEPLPFGAGAGGDPLPGAGGEADGEFDGFARSYPGHDRVVFRDGQDIADAAAGQFAAQRRVVAVD